MAGPLPSLDSLRFFAAAARHLSFTRAAEDLAVSQAAVSQRIRSLEQSLGTRLFYRRNRRLALTELGAAYEIPVREALTRLERAGAQLFPRADSSALSLKLSSSLAARWLLPRLPDLTAEHPEIALRLVTGSPRTGGGEAVADLEIRQATSAGPGEVHQPLLPAEIIAVAAPSVTVGEPAALPAETLIHIMGYEEDWPGWFARAGVAAEALPGGTQFDSSDLALKAAEDGLGVALVRAPLAADAIAAGRLVQLFPRVSYPSIGYHLFGDRQILRRKPARALCDWLLAAAKATALPGSGP